MQCLMYLKELHLSLLCILLSIMEMLYFMSVLLVVVFWGAGRGLAGMAFSKI